MTLDVLARHRIENFSGYRVTKYSVDAQEYLEIVGQTKEGGEYQERVLRYRLEPGLQLTPVEAMPQGAKAVPLNRSRRQIRERVVWGSDLRVVVFGINPEKTRFCAVAARPQFNKWGGVTSERLADGELWILDAATLEILSTVPLNAEERSLGRFPSPDVTYLFDNGKLVVTLFQGAGSKLGHAVPGYIMVYDTRTSRIAYIEAGLDPLPPVVLGKEPVGAMFSQAFLDLKPLAKALGGKLSWDARPVGK